MKRFRFILWAAFPSIVFGEALNPSILWQTLTLQTYNTRVVLLSTMLLGVASGLVGSFLLLRKRSLISDTLSHACLPGIGIMFVLLTLAGHSGKSLPMLLVGAVITGAMGVMLVLWLRNTTKLGDDASMGIVLSVFFGLGIALLSVIQNMEGASAAGLEDFIYGRTASMTRRDLQILLGAATAAAVASLALHKELTLLCFDEAYAASLGWSIRTLDSILLGLVTLVTVAGLQAVGLILIIAFMITPAAAARFWTHDARRMTWLAAGIGGVSGLVGGGISALVENLPAGAIIVLTASSFFLFSLVFGTARGVVKQLNARFRLKRKVGRQHLLRSMYELLETANSSSDEPVRNVEVPMSDLLAKRSWSPHSLGQKLRLAKREDHMEVLEPDRVRLSESGFGEAARITRNHRLWEIYLITHADVAPQHVDRDADHVEHILGADLVRKLERELESSGRDIQLPSSPHTLHGVPAP